MSTIRKKRVRIKKKNFTIFLAIVILVIIILTKGITTLITVITSPTETNNANKIEKKVTTENKKEKNKNKYAILNNVNEEIDYFKEEYFDRYVAYKNKNPDLDDKQIIKNVNMNLDKEKYKDVKETTHLNEITILVNKYNYLAKDYVPDNLENISSSYALSGMKLVDYAKDAFEKMAKAASKENLKIVAMSTYRSYDYQVDLYNRYAKTDGKEKADTYSGRAGYSEHQTGLAADVYNTKEDYTNFEKTKEFTWMQEHAHEYGFILRFPKDKEEETGYHYESWHYRYVGLKAAKYIKENNISFEEYYATKIKD